MEGNHKTLIRLAEMMAGDTLAQEEAFYEEKKAELLTSHEGKIALIKSRRLIGVYDSREAAYAAGVEALGNDPMLIVQIRKEPDRPTVPSLTLGVLRASLPS